MGSVALNIQEQKPTVLHHQLEPLDPLDGTPPDPQVPVLEGVAGRPPNQQGDGLPASSTTWRR